MKCYEELVQGQKLTDIQRMETICDEFCMTQTCGDRDCSSCSHLALLKAGYRPKKDVINEFADTLTATLRGTRYDFNTFKGVKIALDAIEKLRTEMGGGT